TVVVEHPDGQAQVFQPTNTGYVADPAGPASGGAQLTQVGSDYVLTDGDGTQLTFASAGRLLSVRWTDGSTDVITWTNGGRRRIAHTGGPWLPFTYNGNGLLQSVQDSAGHTRTFTYAPAGEQLATATDGRGTCTYAYGTTGARVRALATVTA